MSTRDVLGTIVVIGTVVLLGRLGWRRPDLWFSRSARAARADFQEQFKRSAPAPDAAETDGSSR